MKTMAIWSLNSDGNAFDTNGNKLVATYRGVCLIVYNGFVMPLKPSIGIEETRQYIRDFVKEKHRIDIERGD